MALNVFAHIAAFTVVCKLEDVPIYVEGFLRFDLLDLSTGGVAFHVMPINVRGSEMINFLIS